MCLITDTGDELVRNMAAVLSTVLADDERCDCVLAGEFGRMIVDHLSSFPFLETAIDNGALSFKTIELPADGSVSLSELLRPISNVPDPNDSRRTLVLVEFGGRQPLLPPAENLAELLNLVDQRTTLLCSYDRSKSAPELIANALEIHPLVVIDSKLIPNPYFRMSTERNEVEPSTPLVDQMISRLREISSATDGIQSSTSAAGSAAPIPSFEQTARGAGPQICIDQAGTILEVNELAASSIGSSHEELVGQTLWDVCPDLVDGDRYQQIQRVMSQPEPVQYETYSQLMGYWIEVTLTPKGDQVCLSIRDISRRKQVEQTLNARIRQQAAVAQLGQEALASSNLQAFMDRLVETVKQTLEVDFVKILELLPDASGFRLVAGAGWEPGLVGTEIVGTGLDSQAGYTLQSRGPVIVEDLDHDDRFSGPEILKRHRVISGVSVLFSLGGKPFGVLGVHTRRFTRFTQDDVNFVQSVANVLAAAIDHARSAEIQRHYAAIVSSSDDAIVSETLDRTISGWNAAAERMFGFSAGEIIGQPVTILYPEEFQREAQRLFDHIRRGHRVERHESVWRTKDGRLIDVSILLSPIRDEAGEITGASKTVIDITERKRAELERAASESRLQLALDAGRMGTWDWSVGSNEVTWSENMESIHGLEPGSFGGTFEDFFGSVHPDDQDRVLSAIRQALQDGENYNVEYRNIRPDGSQQWLQARGRIVPGGRGQPDHLTGICTDVTEQVETRQQIARFAAAVIAERDRLQQIVDVIPEGILITDDNGRIVLSNQAARDIWGRPVPDSDWREYDTFGFVQTDGKPCEVEDLPATRALLHGERVIGEQLMIRNATTYEWIPLLVNSAPIRTDEGDITGAVVTFQDISAYKELERQKDDFLQMLSHDLKNPLTSVKGNAQFLRMRARKSAQDLIPAIERIERSAVQAVELIDDLLDLTRLQLGRPVELVRSRTDLARLVADAAQQQASTSGFHRIRVETDLRELNGHVDEMRVLRVLSNLLNNAIKYSPDNSEILITLGRSQDRPGWAEIRVIDHGIGIPAQDLPRLFERFRRGSNVKGQIRGSGLGLASSKQIVEQHGGMLLVESVEGEGSTFTVLLPLQSLRQPRKA